MSESPRNHAHANEALPDHQYLAYVLVAVAKLLIALISKRWPHLR